MSESIGAMDTAFIEDVGCGLRGISKRAQFIEKLSARLSPKLNYKKMARKLLNGKRKSVVVAKTKKINKLELDVMAGKRKSTVKRTFSLPKSRVYMDTQYKTVEYNDGMFANIGDIVCCYV